jgi:hypothetical protein
MRVGGEKIYARLDVHGFLAAPPRPYMGGEVSGSGSTSVTGGCKLMRVSSTNVLEEGPRIEGRGRQMNSEVKIQTNKAKLDAC